MKYSNTYKEDVTRWLCESEESPQINLLGQSAPAAPVNGVLHSSIEDEPRKPTHAASIIATQNLQDDTKPSDSVVPLN